MAFALVATSLQVTGTGAAVNLTVTATTQGNLLVVGLKLPVSETCTSVTDGGGNTYALIGPIANSNNSAHIYVAYGVQIVGGVTTVTGNFSGAVQTKRLGADEFSGNAASNVLTFDKSSTGADTVAGTSLAVTSFAPTANGELISAWATLGANQTFTAGANYTLSSGVDPITLRSQYRLSGTTTETAPMTVGVNANWAEIAVAFKRPAPGASKGGGLGSAISGVIGE